MKRPIQVLFTLTIVLALASITLSLGSSLTGSVILGRLDLGMHFSYMSMISLALTGLLLFIEVRRSKTN